MTITIDGPTASGKSSVALHVAQRLNALYINSGLLFRAVAYVLHAKHRLNESFTHQEIIQLFHSHEIVYTSLPAPQIDYQQKPITALLKTPPMDKASSIIATNPEVRVALLEYQRELANNFNVVADGRDCGTVVFPQAEHKFFITASLEVRALRWQKDHPEIPLKDSKEILQERDTRDAMRSIAPLRPALDALIIDTSDMTIEDVVNTILKTVLKETPYR